MNIVKVECCKKKLSDPDFVVRAQYCIEVSGVKNKESCFLCKDSMKMV